MIEQRKEETLERQRESESRDLRRCNEEPNYAQSPTALGSYDPHKTADM